MLQGSQGRTASEELVMRGRIVLSFALSVSACAPSDRAQPAPHPAEVGVVWRVGLGGFSRPVRLDLPPTFQVVKTPSSPDDSAIVEGHGLRVEVSECDELAIVGAAAQTVNAFETSDQAIHIYRIGGARQHVSVHAKALGFTCGGDATTHRDTDDILAICGSLAPNDCGSGGDAPIASDDGPRNRSEVAPIGPGRSYSHH